MCRLVGVQLILHCWRWFPLEEVAPLHVTLIFFLVPVNWPEYIFWSWWQMCKHVCGNGQALGLVLDQVHQRCLPIPQTKNKPRVKEWGNTWHPFMEGTASYYRKSINREGWRIEDSIQPASPMLLTSTLSPLELFLWTWPFWELGKFILIYII